MFGLTERGLRKEEIQYDRPYEHFKKAASNSILIVDDDKGILNQLSQSFAICAKHYAVYTAQSGPEAAEILRSHRVDILLSIFNVPAMRDFELIDYTKTYHPATRIFVMSEEEPFTKRRILADPRICGYIKKPFRIETIYSILRI